MDYKKNEDGSIIVGENGHPMVTQDDGTELELRATEVFKKIPELNDEARGHREEKEKIAKELEVLNASLEGLDLAKAREAIKITEGLDDKSLIDSKKAEEAKASLLKEADEKRLQLIEEFNEKLKERDDIILQNDVKQKQRAISDKFSKTNAFKGTIFETAPDLAEKYFGVNFKVDENGAVTGYDENGRQFISPDPHKTGSNANFDECCKILLDSHPNASSFRFAGSGGNDGSSPNVGVSGDGVMRVTRAQLTVPSAYQEITAKAKKLGVKVEIID